jgi:hypothetical protein
LHLEGVYYDTFLGYDECEKIISCDAKKIIEVIQTNFVFATSLKDHAKIFQMLGSLLGMDREVIQLSKDDM